jgi:hypothetical protein
MNFKKWLVEVGMGGGGAGGGMEPVKQDPTAMPGAFSDYHSEDQTDPANQNGQLPPVKKKKKLQNKNEKI